MLVGGAVVEADGLRHRRQRRIDVAVPVAGERQLVVEVSGAVVDDHTPFQELGVRAIDLIDFTYPYWHRPTDTLDKVSAGSLDAAGEALVEMLQHLSRQSCRSG